MGTGSGIIAVSLAAGQPDAAIIALDRSLPTLKVAQHNARQHALSQIHFVQSDLLEPFSMKFNLICANLPYIPTGTLSHLPVADWEPRVALNGGESGLELILRLLEQAQTRLAPKACLLLEIEASLGETALVAADAAFPEAQTTLHQDLAGLDRMVEIRLK